jgi:hypothetical protein
MTFFQRLQKASTSNPYHAPKKIFADGSSGGATNKASSSCTEDASQVPSSAMRDMAQAHLEASFHHHFIANKAANKGDEFTRGKHRTLGTQHMQAAQHYEDASMAVRDSRPDDADKSLKKGRKASKEVIAADAHHEAINKGDQ